MAQYEDPRYIIDKIDYEGWPDALEWLVGLKFEDQELDQIIYEAYQAYKVLEGWRSSIEKRLEILGVYEEADG